MARSRRARRSSVESLPYNRVTIARPKRERFATLRVGPAAPSRAVIPTTLRHIEPLVTGPGHADPRGAPRGRSRACVTAWTSSINKEQHHRDQPVKVGELQVWDVVNDTRMDHPFHLHGFFFQVSR